MTYSRYQQLKPLDLDDSVKFITKVYPHGGVCWKSRSSREKKKQGLPSKLSIADQVFVSLEYWRVPNLLTSGNPGECMSLQSQDCEKSKAP